jgi:hypothetical protein
LKQLQLIQILRVKRRDAANRELVRENGAALTANRANKIPRGGIRQRGYRLHRAGK